MQKNTPELREITPELREITPELREKTPELRRAIFLSNSLQNIEILNNTCSTAQNLSGRLCKPAQLELIISQRPDILKQWEYIFAYVLSA